MKPILKTALFNSLATAIYIVVIGSFMFYAGQAKFGQKDTVFVPIFVLMLLVFSAAFTGALIFGSPVLWYLDGKKREALSLLGYTLGTFFAITLVVFFAMLALLRG